MKKKHLPIGPKVREDRPNRADFHHGTTTQGGSDFGQGSNDLDKHAIRQGSEKNDGSDYANEQGWDNEALRNEDIKEDQNGGTGRHGERKDSGGE